MTWYFDVAADGSEIDLYDHEGTLVATIPNEAAPRVRKDAQGIPVVPDLRAVILDGLISRGQTDLYALRVIGEALTGAGLEEGVPPE